MSTYGRLCGSKRQVYHQINEVYRLFDQAVPREANITRYHGRDINFNSAIFTYLSPFGHFGFPRNHAIRNMPYVPSV